MITYKFADKENAKIVTFSVDDPNCLPSIADIKDRIQRQLTWQKESKSFKFEENCAVNVRNHLTKEYIYYNIESDGENGYRISVYYTVGRYYILGVIPITRLIIIVSIVLAFFTYGVSLLFIIPIFVTVYQTMRTLPPICESVVMVIEKYNDELNKNRHSSHEKNKNQDQTTSERMAAMKEKLSGYKTNSQGFKIAEDGTIIRS